MLKECKKENKKYKIIALDAVSDILEAYQIDKFEEIMEVIKKYVKVCKHFLMILFIEHFLKD